MAVVKIWKIETRLDRTIDYAEDKKKTENTDYKDMKGNQLQQVIDYAMNEYKTEKQYYTTGINCSTESAYEEMMITKKQFNKTNGILGFHAYQSFKGQEVSPEIAHEIGLKLAEEMWGDRFEVVVTTHLNSNNIHNHFVINSVSFVDGKNIMIIDILMLNLEVHLITCVENMELVFQRKRLVQDLKLTMVIIVKVQKKIYIL